MLKEQVWRKEELVNLKWTGFGNERRKCGRISGTKLTNLNDVTMKGEGYIKKSGNRMSALLNGQFIGNSKSLGNNVKWWTELRWLFFSLADVGRRGPYMVEKG